MLNIIIPVYKARDTLPDLLSALCAQTYKMFMVTISQDGDGEDYSDIIDDFKKRGLHINLIKSEKNYGPGHARQMGIDNAGRCDYIMFCDADDLVTPRIVEVLYKEAKRNMVDILTSDFIAETEHSSQYMQVQRTPVTWCHGKIYRLDYLRKNNIRFLDELRLNEDSYFNLVAVNSTTKKKSVGEYTYIWRHNENSLTRCKDEETFFARSWNQYIFGQVKAIEKIIDITGDINTNVLAATLINVYYHCMTARFLGGNYDIVRDLLDELRDVDEVQKKFEKKEFWEYIHNNLKACGYNDGNLFFYKERFIDWFVENVLYNTDLIEHS